MMYLFLTNHRQDVLTSSRKITARKRSGGTLRSRPRWRRSKARKATLAGILRSDPGTTLLAKFDGEFASHSTTYGGTGTFRYRW